MPPTDEYPGAADGDEVVVIDGAYNYILLLHNFTKLTHLQVSNNFPGHLSSKLHIVQATTLSIQMA